MKSWIGSLGVLGIVAALGCTQQVGDDGKSATPVSAADKSFKLTPVALDAKFERWIPSPTGEVHALLLDNGSVVHVPHGVDTNVLKAGDAVHVEGKTFGDDNKMLAMAEVKKDGAVVIAAPEWKGHHGEGKHHQGFGKGEKHGFGKGEKPSFDKPPPGVDAKEWQAKVEKMKAHHAAKKAEHDKKMDSLEAISADSKVAVVLPGRFGKPHGFILNDGTVAYLPHHTERLHRSESDDADITINKGDSIKVEGRGGTYPSGKALEIKTLEINGTKKTF